jgi:hypothetical protein
MVRAKRMVVVLLAILGWAGSIAGCAGFQPAPQRRSPYRSAMLNADFTSAYPRSTELDPFGIDTQREDTEVASQGATPEAPPTVDDGATLAAHIEEAQVEDEIYDPTAAAGYVTAVYTANETATHNGDDGAPSILDIYRHTQRNGTIYHSTRPAVGDLVFFHNTFDRNGDDRSNDWYTHIGVVESVDDQGNVAILSYLDGRVSRTVLNLERSDVGEDTNGEVINTQMRRRREGDAEYTQYLASQLFAGFGSLLGERTEFLIIDNWQPGMNVAME